MLNFFMRLTWFNPHSKPYAVSAIIISVLQVGTEAWRYEVICTKAELEVTEPELQPECVWYTHMDSTLVWMFQPLSGYLRLYHVSISLQVFSLDVEIAQEDMSADK